MRIILKFYTFIWHYKGLFLGAILLLTFGEIANNYSLYVIKDLVDSFNHNGFQRDALFQIIWLFVIFRISGTLLTNLGIYFNDRNDVKASMDLRNAVVSHIHDLDFSYHAQKQSGSLISAIKRGDGAFSGIDLGLNRNLILLIVDFFFLLTAFFSINYLLSIVAFLAIAINLITTKYILNSHIKARVEFNVQEDNISGLIVDNMINYETVKLFAQEKWEQQRLIKAFQPWLISFYKFCQSFRLLDISANLIAILGSATSLLIAINMLGNNQISIGEFSLIIAFVANFFPKLNAFTFEVRGIIKQMTDLENYIKLLDVPIQVKDKVNAAELKNIKGSINFENITFAYPQRNAILQNFSLDIMPGESVALVGYSGAGKTTLIKLLLRFYDVNQGAIKIDGQNIADITKTSLRKNIGLVPQEPILFNDNIAFNISYPKPNADISEIKYAAKLANLDDFIESLPQKYDTIVGERGIKLSGGQKQRLAIARMFLADPRIIIFDEATSQLDSESEKLIQEAFWRIAQNKTTLIIAHRLSTVMRADRIIVIDKGQIVEAGKHNDLINKDKGIYKKLWNMQKGVMLDVI